MDWTTAQEDDMRVYIKVGERVGKNEANVENNYFFAHSDYRAGINYYRLKQVDTDGRFEYSEVVTVAVPSEENQVIVFPNPSPEGRFQIAFNTATAENVTIEIFDIAGRKVFDNTENAQIGLLDLQALEKGMYILRAEQGDFIYTEKLVLY